MKISAIIICKNEEGRIETCLESVKWVDEIVIMDNGSIDKTLEIAKKYTSKVYSFEDQDFSSLRNKGIEKVTGDWVLYIDADERILQPLKEEIKNLITQEQFSAYAISRKNIIFGKEVSYGPYKKDWVIRLVKKSAFKGWVGKVHEYITFNGKLGYAKDPLLHLTHRDIDHFILKSLEWSKIDAKLRLDSGHPPMTQWRFFRILITEIFYQGIIRRGFFNGTVGTIDSMLQAFSFYMTYVRLWQLQQPKPLDEVYREIDKGLIKNNFHK